MSDHETIRSTAQSLNSRYVARSAAGEVHAFWTNSAVPFDNRIKVCGDTDRLHQDASSYYHADGPAFVGPRDRWLPRCSERSDVHAAPESVPRERSGLCSVENGYIPRADPGLADQLAHSAARSALTWRGEATR